MWPFRACANKEAFVWWNYNGKARTTYTSVPIFLTLGNERELCNGKISIRESCSAYGFGSAPKPCTMNECVHRSSRWFDGRCFLPLPSQIQTDPETEGKDAWVSRLKIA